MMKTQGVEGSFQHDVVRLLFQALVLEFMMFIDRRRGEAAEGSRRNRQQNLKNENNAARR